MATWKKLIVSGSEISQLNDDLGIHLSGSAGGAVDSVGTIKLGETGSLSVRPAIVTGKPPIRRL